MINVLLKSTNTRLCKGLKSSEIACKCSNESCRMTMYCSDMIKAYEGFRELVGVPLIINSGYRCPQHNKAVGGTPMSRHQTGEAIDISLQTLDHLSREDIEFAAVHSGFKFVKFYKTFVHMDVRKKH